jgi:putative component of toxin-antitoxin plasmid stabilization module
VTWTIEFFEDDQGRQPAREWLQSLDSLKRASAIAAIEVVLAELGLDVCATEYGKPLGSGMFEFRIRHDEAVIRSKAGGEGDGERGEVLLRIFCHAYGQRIVLLLGGYDKGAAPSHRRQDREIEKARGRLRSFKLQQSRRRAGARRRGEGSAQGG